MGAEALCVAHFGGESSQGKAHLETDFLLFRGSFRVKVLFQEIRQLTEAGGQLSVSFGGGMLCLDLGTTAPKWLQKIQNPPSLLDKLGVKTGRRISVWGIHDEKFLASLRNTTSQVKTKLTPMS